MREEKIDTGAHDTVTRGSAVNGFIIRVLWLPLQAACLHLFKCTVLHGAGQFLTSQQYYCPVEVQLEHCWGLSRQETWTGCLLGSLAVWL